MKRLKSNPDDGGLPYINSDFWNILQNQHIKSYVAHLDSINDWQYGEVASNYKNRGIVLLGCNVINGSQNSATFDFTNSLIYLPGLTANGDFLEPDSSIANNNYTIAHSGSVYLVANTVNTDSRVFRDGFNKVVIETKNFTITSTQPTSDVSYIEFTWISQINRLVTQRNYKRILKYNIFNTGDIQMTTNINDYDNTTGIGYGDSFGFALCNGQNGTFDLRGRFGIGYDPTTANTPADNSSLVNNQNQITYDSTDVKNYGAIGNIGGGLKTPSTTLPSHRLTVNQIASHDHNGQTGNVVGDLSHTHDVPTRDSYLAGSEDNTAAGRGAARATKNVATTGVSSGNLQHTHTIQSQGGNANHETRPPYIVLAYYQKINVN